MLDQAGLQPPKTVDDVINIVKVLNEKGITDNAVLPARADMTLLSGDTASFDWLFSAYNAYPGMWIEDKDGKVVYGSVQPEVKAALAKAQQMYVEGIIPPDFALWDGNKAVELVAANKVGIFMGAWWSTWWPLQDSIKNDNTVQWKATLIQSEDGKYYQRGYSAQRGFLVIRKGLEHPEAVMKLINISEDCGLKKNEWYNELKWNDGAKYFTTAGPLLPPLPGAKYLDEISRRYKAIMDVVEGRVKMEDADPETAQLAASVIKEQEEPLADIGNWAQAVSWTEGAATFAEQNMIQKIPAFDGTTETLMKTNAILTDLEKQTFLKITMNEASIDEFDVFVEQWHALGGEAATQEINDIVK
jgi:putative aldouronate transport system substrate-binding protein